jgi:predicted glycosyltransferase involved in capsule biosynthesis
MQVGLEILARRWPEVLSSASSMTMLRLISANYIKKSLDNLNVFYWSDAPHILIVSGEVYFRAGGYDERHPLRGAEAVEIRERLKSLGYELKMLDISVKHLRD